jgi:hypothetical protein
MCQLKIQQYVLRKKFRELVYRKILLIYQLRINTCRKVYSTKVQCEMQLIGTSAN